MNKKEDGHKIKSSKIKRLKEWAFEHKLISISVVILLVLVIAAFGTKTLLYINLILGNDIIVKLDADKKDIYLLRGQKEEISFEAKASTNPFCSALCHATFIDISRGKFIENEEFRLSPAAPLEKKYMITPPQTGTGMDLYRFDLECRSLNTILCLTKNEPSTRSILITAQYSLNEEEEELKKILKEQITDFKEQLSAFKGEMAVIEEAYDELNKAVIPENIDIIGAKKDIETLHDEMFVLEDIWNQQDYYLLEQESENIKQLFQKSEKEIKEINNSLSAEIARYNEIIERLDSSGKELTKMKETAVINSAMALELDRTINEFNKISDMLKERAALAEKDALQKDISEKIGKLAESLKEDIKRESLKRELETGIAYDSLCEINYECVSQKSMEELAGQSEFEIKEVCKRADSLNEFLKEINESAKESFINQSYPDNKSFWSNITSKIKNIKQKIALSYIEQLPEEKSNSRIVHNLLIEFSGGINFTETEGYNEYNLTPALVAELTNQQPVSCNFTDIIISHVKNISISKIELSKSLPVPIRIEFKEPAPKCCVFGKCEDCCITEECKNNPSKYPTVFIHGHAIDKDVSAEYSLEGFNKIQKKLEEDGYLNAGTVTLYSERKAQEGVWGLPNAPLTIRASYYFDVFEQPENYIVVQAKSENIDTYAVRLKELIDIIKYKTDRPKVNIVAFSMGGLVARRYVQIFGGSSVEKLILIGAPNKGIAGGIADYCHLTGEKLECRDMNSDSLFINKLNRGELLKIPIYNIIGAGCRMSNGDGDGVVLKDNAWLEGAYNYVINGSCSEKAVPLHLRMRDTDLYPETYEIIRESLKDDLNK